MTDLCYTQTHIGYIHTFSPSMNWECTLTTLLNPVSGTDLGFHKGGGGGGFTLSFRVDHQMLEGISSGVDHKGGGGVHT